MSNYQFFLLLVCAAKMGFLGDAGPAVDGLKVKKHQRPERVGWVGGVGWQNAPAVRRHAHLPHLQTETKEKRKEKKKKEEDKTCIVCAKISKQEHGFPSLQICRPEINETDLKVSDHRKVVA